MQPTSAWDASLRMSIEFTMTCALPKPVRTFKDPITGVTIHQLTDGDEPSVHFYFTSPNWLALMMVFAVNSRVSNRSKARWRFSPAQTTP